MTSNVGDWLSKCNSSRGRRAHHGNLINEVGVPLIEVKGQLSFMVQLNVMKELCPRRENF